MGRVIGTCDYCRCERDGHMEDFGIGSYAYGSATGVQVDLQAVCDVCGEILIDMREIPAELEYPDE